MLSTVSFSLFLFSFFLSFFLFFFLQYNMLYNIQIAGVPSNLICNCSTVYSSNNFGSNSSIKLRWRELKFVTNVDEIPLLWFVQVTVVSLVFFAKEWVYLSDGWLCVLQMGLLPTERKLVLFATSDP